MTREARLFVVSGPSGVGKGTLVALLRERLTRLGLTVSATTREPRPGEVDGVSYHFLDDAEFERRVGEGEFLEWAWVHGHRYGTLRSEVERVLAEGRSVVLEIDVQGALSVRASHPEAVLVFIEPPSPEELERRLRGRGTEDEASIERRLANARREMSYADRYDVRIVNDDLDRAVDDLAHVIDSYETRSSL
ncbi:guanylate kinase [Olsenella sp. An290]|uniref:guanylate kinase n=1 Tax=Olsenella sp. An290 TaxID=1965625 RepID=UPI000B38C8CA|nr:guanylate kinase [Olsenella sp. An290]OUO35505.1 guanylate kinase [Olsenella sp. An290]